MIVHSLGKEQSVVIGDQIVVRVIEVRGDEVLLEIEHPDGRSIRLGEECWSLRREVAGETCCR